MTVTGDLEKAQQTCQMWAHTYPRDTGPDAFLAGIVYPPSPKYEGVVEEGKRTVELNPDSAIAYNILALGYAYLNRPDEAKSTSSEPMSASWKSPTTWLSATTSPS